ncbi:MAG TPA: ABC transporter permease [Pseudonocardiaceae bacterium]|nr:ABC transporter permease [Pseudonocardiaceae bacterium]
MTGYIIRRILQSALVVILVSMVTFLLTELLPGGPARAMLGPRASAQQLQDFIHANGYDRPVPVQYGIWVDHVVHGNFGYSLKLNQSVGALIADRLPKTVLLMAVSILVALIIAVPLGIYQARRRNSFGDYAVTSLAFVFYAMPSFLLGLLLILVFSADLGWFAPTAPQSGNVWQIFSQANAMVLPIATLALITIATFSRYMRSSVMENLTQEYVRTARANGATEGRVMVVHVLRNAMIPIATLLGLALPSLVAGAAITESVFNYPGMGYTFINEAAARDYPVVLGFAFVVSVATVLGSLLADIAYAVLDPRVKY